MKDIYKEIDIFFDTFNYDVEVKILEILIEKCDSENESIKQTAFEWIFIFLQKYKYFLIQNKKAKSSGYKMNKTLSSYRITQKDSMSISSVTSDVHDELLFINESTERKIPVHLFPKILNLIIKSYNYNKNADYNQIKKVANDCNNELITILEFFPDSTNTHIKLFEDILIHYFRDEKETTLDLAIIWTNKLFKKFHNEIFTNLEHFMESFVTIILHNNDNIFNATLDMLCEFAKYKEEYLEIIFKKLLEKLCYNKKLLDTRGTTILKKLCNLIGVERVYTTFAEVMSEIKV